MIRISALVLFIISLAMASCLSEEEYHFTQDEIQRFLAGDTVKYWHLKGRTINGQNVDLVDCEKSRYLGLAYHGNTRIYASFMLGGTSDCFPSNNEIIDEEVGTWQLMADPAFNQTYDTLVLVHEGKRVLKTIIDVSPWTLVLEEFKIDTIVSNRDTTLQELLINERFELLTF